MQQQNPHRIPKPEEWQRVQDPTTGRVYYKRGEGEKVTIVDPTAPAKRAAEKKDTFTIFSESFVEGFAMQLGARIAEYIIHLMLNGGNSINSTTSSGSIGIKENEDYDAGGDGGDGD